MFVRSSGAPPANEKNATKQLSTVQSIGPTGAAKRARSRSDPDTESLGPLKSTVFCWPSHPSSGLMSPFGHAPEIKVIASGPHSTARYVVPVGTPVVDTCTT